MTGSNLPNSSLLAAIQRLKEATMMLPRSTPEGSSDGVVWRNFNLQSRDIQGPIFESIDQAFTRCFSHYPGSDINPVNNILRGAHGMDVVIRFLEDCAASPKMDSGALHLTELKVGQLINLVHTRIKSLPEDPPKKSSKKRRHTNGRTRRRTTHPKPRHSETKQDECSSASDPDFSPHEISDELSSSESNEGDETDLSLNNSQANKIKEQENSSLQTSRQRSKKRPKLTTSENGDTRGPNTEDTELVKHTGKRRGRKSVTREWAFANYMEPVAAHYPDTKKPAWLLKCKHCPSIRHFPRTEGYEFHSKKQPYISATNLAAHLKTCQNLPAHLKLEVVKSRLNRRSEMLTSAQASLGEMFKATNSNANPGSITLTPTVFRSTLIQGVVRDNYPLTFGEGKGMRQVFGLVSPTLVLPSHSTMRRDLAKLYDVLSARVRHAQDSQFAVTSDAWTSKSFVYSLGGAVVTFIDKSWNIQEFVLDIVHLDADHTGAGMGKRLFKALDHMGAAPSIIASITDNASNNRTLNLELSRRLSEKYGFRLNVDTMSVTCLCHALHLICGAILSKVKAMDSLETDEAYAMAKAFEEGEAIEESAEVLEEEEQLQHKVDDHDQVESSDDDLSDFETSGQPSLESSSQSVQNSANDNELNCVQKVHLIAVHVTSSAARRKRMRIIIRSLGLELRAVIKSVRIRWNSVLAEIRRAILLKPAFNQYVATLDQGKSGSQLRSARALKKKLTVVDEEWDVLEELEKILVPFELATKDYSRRGRAVLHSVLPTYALLREKLVECQTRLSTSTSSLGGNMVGLIEAIKAGEAKMDKYFNLALKSDLTLLGSILHPGMRLSYLRDSRRWGNLGSELAERGQKLLEYLYELYRLGSPLESVDEHTAPTDPEPVALGTSSGGWIDSLITFNNPIDSSAFPEELRDYFDGRYKFRGGDILLWWKENEPHFPILSRIARDMLAIPATSVSVERLFSRCKLVMSDYRNMSVDTARQIISCQQWLEAGLGADLPDFLSNNVSNN